MGRQDVASDGEDSVWSRHLLEKIRVIWHCHELGEGWSPKYGMVGSLERRHPLGLQPLGALARTQRTKNRPVSSLQEMKTIN